METPEGVHLLQGAISEEECDYFTQKLIRLREDFKLKPFFDEPSLLVIEEPEEEDKLFIEKCHSIFCAQIKEKYNDGPYPRMDGDLTIWRPNVSGTPHVDNADPTIKSYGAKYSGIFYLNDNFNGGEIEFPNIGFSYKPVKGSFIWFPDDPIADTKKWWHDWDQYKHVHRVKKVLGNYRCTLPMWIG